jgi:uncharacterized membrane protein (DUF485 family)
MHSSKRSSDRRAIHAAGIVALARRRWLLAASLTGLMVIVYFGFIGLVAYRADLLARQLRPGLTLGIVLGALVIVAAWLLTLAYVWWANSVYDPALAQLRETREVPAGMTAPGVES